MNLVQYQPVLNTESAPIEHRRYIKFYDFSAAHSGHFCYFYVQKYSNFGQKLSKNDHCVPNLCLMAFYSRVAFYRRGYGISIYIFTVTSNAFF